MSFPERRRLRKRLWSNLDEVRDALRNAELYSCVPAADGEDGRLFAPDAAVEDDDGCRAAKRRKVSPFAERARERLAGRLASVAAALPDHVVAFLQERRVGDADSRGDGGELEMHGVQSVTVGDLFRLKMLLDKFAPESSTPKLLVDKFATRVSTPTSRGGRGAPLAASGVSCLSQAQHRGAGGSRLTPVQEEGEEEAINICGGVSRIAIRDIAEEYGELVNDIGVQLLSPLQRKYVDLAEEDRYVDICGDASPVAFQAKAGASSSPSLSTSSSDSDETSTDSDSSNGSPEALRKENSSCGAGEPVPAPEADPIQGVHSTPPPRPAAPEAIHIAEPENQCAAAAAATVFAVTKSPPAPTVLPKERGALAQPPEQAPEAVQIAEPEEPKEKCVAPAATVHPITGSAPPAAVLPNENAVAAQIAEPQSQPQAQPQSQPQESQTSDLIARAKARHQLLELERKRRAMAKARHRLLELERAARPDERIHPRDMEVLGIAAFEHVVSTVRDARTAQPQVNDELGGLRFSPGGPSILQQLGVFLKADEGCEEEDGEKQAPPLAVASDGEDMDIEIEDGQIL